MLAVLEKQTFQAVFSNVTSQHIWSQNRCTCIICLWNEFSNVSTNRISEQIESHIGYNCANFLQSDISNASSNCLLQQMHSHIGCMCAIFLHCEFSHVCPNCLLSHMHSHIDCNGKAFLQSDLPNVFSSCPHEQMRSHIGAWMNWRKFAFDYFLKWVLKCWLKPRARTDTLIAFEKFFAGVIFQMCPQTPCSNRLIITLAAFVWFPPVWDFKCHLRSAAKAEA